MPLPLVVVAVVMALPNLVDSRRGVAVFLGCKWVDVVIIFREGEDIKDDLCPPINLLLKWVAILAQFRRICRRNNSVIQVKFTIIMTCNSIHFASSL